MLLLLEKSGIGCHIDTMLVGAIGYADDLTLICPSLRSLVEMVIAFVKTLPLISILTFNPKKTACIKFGSKICESGYHKDF